MRPRIPAPRRFRGASRAGAPHLAPPRLAAPRLAPPPRRPCPCRGEKVPAAGGGHAAGPCTYQPAAQRFNVKNHLMKRHGKSNDEAAALIDALEPIERDGNEDER